jgi:hypothetical protein
MRGREVERKCDKWMMIECNAMQWLIKNVSTLRGSYSSDGFYDGFVIDTPTPPGDAHKVSISHVSKTTAAILSSMNCMMLGTSRTVSDPIPATPTNIHQEQVVNRFYELHVSQV